jgi:hypothetical protein
MLAAAILAGLSNSQLRCVSHDRVDRLLQISNPEFDHIVILDRVIALSLRSRINALGSLGSVGRHRRAAAAGRR